MKNEKREKKLVIQMRTKPKRTKEKCITKMSYYLLLFQHQIINRNQPWKS